MADLSIPGVSKSKYQTEKRIEDLVKLEAKKLETLDKRRQEKVDHRAAWQRINRLAQQLERAAHKLYSLDSPFRMKQVISAHPDVLSGEAQRGVPEGNYRIEVEALASAQSLQSSPLDKRTEVPAGKYAFAVGEEVFRVDFAGGPLNDLVNELNQQGRGVLSTSLVDLGNGKQRFVLSSLRTGADQEISFQEDAERLATELGLTGKRLPLRILLPEGGEPFSVRAGQQQRIPLSSPYTIYPGAVFSYIQDSLAEGDAGTEPVESGGLRRSYDASLAPVSYQDVTLFNLDGSEALKRIRLPTVTLDEKSTTESAVGNIALLDQNGESFPLLSFDDRVGEHQIKLDESEFSYPATPVTELIVSNQSSRELTLTQMSFEYENDQTGNAVLHPLKAAANARLKYDDVEIERPSNQIDDVIPGVTLSLKSAKPGTEIEVGIQVDYQAIEDEVVRLVQSYNALLTELNITSGGDETVIEEKVNFSEDERRQAKERLGVLQGSMEVNRLRDRLRRVSSISYSTQQGEVALARLGISTNVDAGSVGIVKSKLRGYLEMDTEKFSQALKDDWELVRDVLSFDSDGDLVLDQGLAYSLRQISYEHIRTGGTIRLRLKTLNDRIKVADKEILDYRKYLDDYRKKLQRKYALMEGALDKLEALQQNLDSFTPGGSK